MHVCYQNLAIVIPCLDPTETLVSYVQALLAQGFTHIYVVNDGSHPSYTPLFQRVCVAEECTLLTHSQNRGKGAALKTAYRHILHTFPQCEGVITADSDGQHAIKDVCRLADCLVSSHGTLLLGGEAFLVMIYPSNLSSAIACPLCCSFFSTVLGCKTPKLVCVDLTLIC